MRIRSRGVTLVELMVAVSLLSVGILSFFGAFRFITKSISVSRSRTLAANLAQEKVESLKNYTYYSLLITTAATVDNSFSPPMVYDSIHYPPETIDIGGAKFERYTFVSLAQVDGNVISTKSYTYPDTGLKQITVTIAWRQGNETKTWTLNNLLENPNINPLDATISGTISSAVTNVPIAGALVRTQENPDWNATTAADGTYSFKVFHGSYTIKASSAGWYSKTSSILDACLGCSLTGIDLQLTKVASGNFMGAVWMNTGLVISQVVISTRQSDQNNFVAQYVELFNPTTYTIDIAGPTPNVSPPSVRLYANSSCSSQQFVNCADPARGVKLYYVNVDVGPGQYYVIANTDTFTAGGKQVVADAYYTDDANTLCSPQPAAINWNLAATPPMRLLMGISGTGHAGSFWLLDASGKVLDKVGWSHAGTNPAYYEGTPIYLANGLEDQRQLVRVPFPAADDDAIANCGKAYDSDNNTKDFVYPSIPGYDTIRFPPLSTADPAQTVFAGKPALGAYVGANDTLSGSTRAYAVGTASGTLSLTWAKFVLEGVTTGTWTVTFSSNSYFKEIATATIIAGQSVGIPNATTEPPWLAPDVYATNLDSSTLNGFVGGVVTDVTGRAIPGLTVLVGGGLPKTTGDQGDYFTETSSGLVAVIVNPNNQDTAYVESIAVPEVFTGMITKQDFTVTQGGILRGYVTTGTTPLPNIVLTANIGGDQKGAATSDATGMFNIRNLSTGTYTVSPSLDTGQSATPVSYAAVLSAAETVDVGTFTISGAFGKISGRVRDAGGTLVTTGALLVAGFSDPPSPPPAVCGSSSAALSPFYTVSSKADGSYELEVRGSTTSAYFLRAYWPNLDLNTGILNLKEKGYSGISVSAGATTTKDVDLP